MSFKDNPDAIIAYIREECRYQEELEKVDNKKLLWLLLNTPQFKDWPMDGPISAIRGAIEDRLYPEYDGDKVQITERGWKTPEGEINYL